MRTTEHLFENILFNNEYIMVEALVLVPRGREIMNYGNCVALVYF